MTHAELVQRAVAWLRGTARCRVVLSEIQSAAGEVADAIGWRAVYRSVLVECKVSRADFRADRHKPWRRFPEMGLGQRRFYMTPPGLVTPQDLPPGWGLLEPRPGRVRVIVEAAACESSREREIALLVSELARYQAQGIRYLTVAEQGGVTAAERLAFTLARRDEIQEAQALMGRLGMR